MNCYLCLVETGCRTQPAYVLCQKCMAGICQAHLVEMGAVSLSGYPPRPHFFCLRCSHLAYPPRKPASLPPDHQRQQGEITTSRRSWWQQLWRFPRGRQTVLLTPEEALETVEDYLRQQRK